MCGGGGAAAGERLARSVAGLAAAKHACKNYALLETGKDTFLTLNCNIKQFFRS